MAGGGKEMKANLADKRIGLIPNKTFG